MLLGQEREGWRRRWIRRQKKDESRHQESWLQQSPEPLIRVCQFFFSLEAMKIYVCLWGQQERGFFINPFCKRPWLVIPHSGLQAAVSCLEHGNPIPWAVLKQMRFQLGQVQKAVKFPMCNFLLEKVSPLSHISISVKYFTETKSFSFPLVSARIELYDSIIM